MTTYLLSCPVLGCTTNGILCSLCCACISDYTALDNKNYKDTAKNILTVLILKGFAKELCTNTYTYIYIYIYSRVLIV
jgi:hypothetical protein